MGNVTFRKRGFGFDVLKEDGAAMGYLTLRRNQYGIVGQFSGAGGKQYWYYFLKPTGATYDGYVFSPDDWKRLAAAKDPTVRSLAAQGAVEVMKDWLSVRGEAALESFSRLAMAKGKPDYSLTLRSLTKREVGVQANGTGTAAQPAAPTRVPAPSGEIDPTSRPSFPLPSTKNLSSNPDVTICNEGSSNVAVGVVRSYGAFAALTKDSWIAEGFFTIAPDACREMDFGFFQSLSQGYLSSVQMRNGRWVTANYSSARRNQDDDAAATFRPMNKSICWPNAGDEATNVSPDVACEGSARNVRFNFWYRKNGMTRKFVLNITHAGFGVAVSQREFR